MPLVVATDSFLFSLATHLMVKNQKKILLLVCFTEKVVTKADESRHTCFSRSRIQQTKRADDDVVTMAVETTMASTHEPITK
jgi:hypothetical protein